jgi:hypothetical protein
MADKRHTAQLPIASYDHISKLLSAPLSNHTRANQLIV